MAAHPQNTGSHPFRRGGPDSTAIFILPNLVLSNLLSARYSANGMIAFGGGRRR